MTDPTPEPLPPEAPAATGRRKARKGAGLFWTGMVLLVLMVVVTIFAESLAPFSATQTSPNPLASPGGEHVLGTDSIGRDVLSRVLVGGQSTLLITFSAALIALVAGVMLGLTAGYFGGWFDQLVMRGLDIAFAFPVFLLAITVVAVLGTSITNLVIAIAIVYTPAMTRVVRAPVLSVKRWDHVEVARSIGVTEAAIIRRHVLPSVISPVLVQTSLMLSNVIFTVTALSFLGLGPPPPEPNWGGMLSEGRQFMELAPMTVIAPAGAIVLATLTFIMIGNGLRDMLDVQGSGR